VYMKTVSLKNPGRPIEQLSAFEYAETTNPQSPRYAVTSLEEARFTTLPGSLRTVFRGARLGETRRVWNCRGRARTKCEVSEYTFFLAPN
jgi:hypothetical protein